MFLTLGWEFTGLRKSSERQTGAKHINSLMKTVEIAHMRVGYRWRTQEEPQSTGKGSTMAPQWPCMYLHRPHRQTVELQPLWVLAECSVTLLEHKRMENLWNAAPRPSPICLLIISGRLSCNSFSSPPTYWWDRGFLPCTPLKTQL